MYPSGAHCIANKITLIYLKLFIRIHESPSYPPILHLTKLLTSQYHRTCLKILWFRPLDLTQACVRSRTTPFRKESKWVRHIWSIWFSVRNCLSSSILGYIFPCQSINHNERLLIYHLYFSLLSTYHLLWYTSEELRTEADWLRGTFSVIHGEEFGKRE